MKNLTTLILLIFTINGMAQSSIDNTFTYQGELIFNNAPADGDFDFKFVAYDTKDDLTGTPLSTVIMDSPPITVSNGIFTAHIIFPDDIFMGDKIWLEINVQLATDTNNFQKLLPRQALNSTPYAIHAQFVGTIGENAVTGAEITNGSVTSDDLANDSIGSNQIADGSIFSVDLSNNSVASIHIIDSTIQNQDIADDAITTSKIANGTIVTADIDTSQVQQRIAGSCFFPEYLSSIAQDGSVICARMPLASVNLLDDSGVRSLMDIAIGIDGNPIISYINSIGSRDLKIIKCTTPSCSGFNSPLTLDSIGDVGYYSSIAIGTDGNPVISYYDSSNQALKFIQCTNQSCSSSNPPQILDSGDVGQYTSIVIDTNGNPNVSYYDAGNTSLKFISCNSPSCSGINISNTLDSFGDVGENTNMIIGTDGTPIISYYDAGNQYLKTFKCSLISCLGSNTTTILDSSGDFFRYSSIANATGGNPIISYNTSSGLKIILCYLKNCSNFATPRVLDSTGNIGSFNSIAIGTEGYPIISYYDYTNKDLKIVKCLDTVCSSGNAIPRILDSLGNVGTYTSIAIGSDGKPIISYIVDNSADLKIYSCGNASCSR